MSRKIPVAFLNASLNVGGAETILASLAEHLDDARFDRAVCCLYDAGPIGEKLRARGITVRDRFFSSRRDVRGLARLRRFFREHHTQILYLNNQPMTQFWGPVAARSADVSLVISAFHFSHRRPRHRLRGRVATRITIPLTNVFVCLSDRQRDVLIRSEGLPPERVVVIPNGIDTRAFEDSDGRRSPARRRLHLDDEDQVVTIVAQLRPEKNHALFLRAAERVSGRCPRSRFLVVGDGPDMGRLQDLAHSLGIADRTRFLGLRPDVPDVIAASDLGVLASDTGVETFPLSLLEFMASARPVVATDVGTISDVVEDGVTGVLVGERDEVGLARAIEHLLASPDRRRTMGQAGKDRVNANYTLSMMVGATEQMMITALDG